ncbi:hypothetical protein LC612_31815 [Nostoc sp. CHAB 5834]|nr:hypothetical protein [Nostoc sp. CHAB 5834]
MENYQYVEELAKTLVAAGMDVKSAYTEAMGFEEENSIRCSPFMFAKDIGQEMAEMRKWRNKVSRTRALATKKGVQLWFPATHQKGALEIASRFENAVLGLGGTLETDNPRLPHECASWRLEVGGTPRQVSWRTGADLCESNESDEGLSTAIRLYVEHQVMVSVPPDASQEDLRTVTSAAQWVATFNPMLLGSLDYRALLALGSEEDVFRWALLFQVKPSQQNAGVHSVLSGLKLNTSQLQRAKKSPEERLKALPLTRQWERILKSPAPVGLRIPCMIGFKAGALAKLCDEFKVSLRLRKDLGYLQPLVNLVSLFGAVEAIKRFVKAKGLEWTKDGVHDAGQFVLPTEVQLAPEWAQLCLKHPEATAYAGDFLKVQKAFSIPTTLSGLRKIHIGLSYPKVKPGFEQLVDICYLNKISGSTFEVHQKFWESVTVKDAEFLPHVHVKGAEVGIDNAWEFVKLTAADFRGPLLGMLTGCCQHLEGAGAESAKQGVISPFSGFYVVLQNGKVMAQSWAWRTHT